MYKSFIGLEIDLNNPKTLCEKLNWLKLYHRIPELNIRLKGITVMDEKTDSQIASVDDWTDYEALKAAQNK